MSTLKILAAATVAAASVSLALAQGTPPRPATDPAVGAGQRSTQNTPMGTTGTPGGSGTAAQGTTAGGAAAQGSSAGSAAAGTAGSTGASGSMNSGATAGASSSGSGSMATGSGSGTRTAKRAKADRN